MNNNIFLSVGGTSNSRQETFVSALEERLRIEGLVPKAIGRNTFSVEAPLKAVEKLMDSCGGTVILALERTYFSTGIEKRGGDSEKVIENIRLATPWNQIEAAMSYTRRVPILVLVEDGLKCEGLLEPGYDWYVQKVTLDENSLKSNEFNGVLASWKAKMSERSSDSEKSASSTKIDASKLNLSQIIGALTPGQLWSTVAVFAAIIAGAFALGGNLFP